MNPKHNKSVAASMSIFIGKPRQRAWILVLIVGLIGMGGGCRCNSEEAPEGDATAAVRHLLEEQVEAWNRADLDGFMSGYWRSDSLVFASGGSVTRGWDTVMKRYKIAYGTPELMGRLEFNLLQIDLLGAEHAKVLGRWQVQRSDTTLGGLFTLILRRFPEGWRIVHDHTSSS